MARAGFDSQQALADACGVKQPSVNALLAGKYPMLDLLRTVAEKTGVTFEWLRFGDVSKAPAWAHTLHVDPASRQLINDLAHRAGMLQVDPDARQMIADLASRVSESSNYAPGMRVVGTVVAGDGDISQYVENEESPIAFPDHWQVVRVEGMSAYPVIYPGQLAIIDTSRATSPAVWTDDHRIDLHDNLVLIQTDGEKPRAYLKRFCREPEAPHGFVLASVDGGRSSPWISPERIIVIAPIVAVMFQDPRKPRKKRWHQKTVVVTVDQ